MARIFNRSSNYLKFLTDKILFVSDELTLKNASVTSCYFKINKRHLNLLEHVSYSLLRKHGIPTPNFGVARSKEEAKKVFQEMKVSECVIKAQVLSGGRQLGAFKKGLKKGVHSAYNAEEVESLAGQMIGDYLVTKQTGSAGLICNTVMITERSYPKKEFYFAIMMDRSFNGPALIASAQGGTSIEAVAAATPEAIIMEPVDIIEGLTEAKAKDVCGKVGLTGPNADKTTEILTKLYKMFLATDALLLELNPYVEDVSGNFLALDAKFRFDDYSKFRQKELFDLSDPTQENQVEASAAERGLNYIQLDGNIGCVVNGAGLAMATMDIIKLYKGDPANFLDVGGGATVDNIQFAISTILTDPKVQVILVNIFGGIMRCDVIAQGLVIAVTNMQLTIPLVCRLQGTKKKEAKIIISRSKLKILAIDDLDEAARLTTKLSAIIGLAKEAHIKVKVNTPIPS